MNLTRKRQLRRLTWSVKLKLPSFTITQLPTVLWLTSILYILGAGSLMVGPFFRLHHVACIVDGGNQCPDFVLPELMKYENTLVFLIQTDPIENRLKANLPTAEAVHVSKQFPDKLSAEIVWQRPLANLSIPASSSAYVVGTTGDLITVLTAPDPSLPVIIASSAADLIISDHLTDASLTAALDILKNMSGSSVKTSKINVLSPQDIRVDLPNNMVAVFTSLKPVRAQVLRLQLILSQTTINQGWPIIDLRYDRPTLKKFL